MILCRFISKNSKITLRNSGAELIEQTRNKKSLPSIIKDADGRQIEGDKSMANAFARY